MRNNKPTQDTFTAAQAAAARILASSLAADLHPHTRDSLGRVAAGEGKPGPWNFISVEFRRAGTNCSLGVNVESDSGYRSEYEQDEAGNDYDRMRVLPPQVSWPSHGSQDVGTCFSWVEFYKDVCRLAADIQAEFCGDTRYWRLARTKEQREEQAAKASAERIRNAVVTAFDTVARGARVGGAPKHMPIELLKDIPPGSYDHEFGAERGGKKFHLEVRCEGDVVASFWKGTQLTGLWTRTV